MKITTPSLHKEIIIQANAERMDFHLGRPGDKRGGKSKQQKYR